jgi:hypothetical protein
MITNGEYGSCERNMRSHNKDNELSSKLTITREMFQIVSSFCILFISDSRPGWVSLSGTSSTAIPVVEEVP